MNKYQYMEYTSYHSQSVFKGLIMGECIRYARTNTSQENHNLQVQTFKQQLLKQHYPSKFIEEMLCHDHRQCYLAAKPLYYRLSSLLMLATSQILPPKIYLPKRR